MIIGWCVDKRRSCGGVHSSVAEIETAFWAEGDITDTVPPRSLHELASVALEVEKLSVRCDYARLAPQLAPLITETYRAIQSTEGAERDQAGDVLASAAITSASVLRRFGHTSLAWTATQAAETAADELSAATRTVGDVEHSGMLRLQPGPATATVGGDPEPQFAGRWSTPPSWPTPIPELRNPTFGAANVALWRLSAAMERRHAEQVLTLAPTLTPGDLPSEGRRAQYFVEVGRAYALRRDYQRSLHALLRAEHAAPQKVRNMGPRPRSGRIHAPQRPAGPHDGRSGQARETGRCRTGVTARRIRPTLSSRGTTGSPPARTAHSARRTVTNMFPRVSAYPPPNTYP